MATQLLNAAAVTTTSGAVTGVNGVLTRSAGTASVWVA